MAGSIKILPHYTYEDYKNWKGQWELIHGIPFAMSREPNHQKIASSIIAEFGFALKNTEFVVYIPLDYKVDEETVLQPDMLVVKGDIEKSYLDFAPELIVEVLSTATSLKDKHSKYSIYESQLIKYYVIVCPDTNDIEVYEMKGEAYELKQKGKAFTYQFSFSETCIAEIDFNEIWK
ncbi:MAG: hypothetical protein JWQ96_796 [Segetibacter sp.]|nr:hypothetical protein [Segetibacter sp.]